MNLVADIVAAHTELTAWRRDIHSHPELAFNETRTANFVAEQLESYDIAVTQGVGGTGVVGTLQVGSSSQSIGLRADMDALPMDEHNTFAHKSRYPGRMHGCGHDGHTVMLLAAARYLAQSRSFEGTVQFIFQPAEEANETGSGAKAMIDDGLFERFPVDCVFALHNAPGIKVGAIATRPGALLASMDLFDITLIGKGCHGAMPHKGIDPITIAAHLQLAWQTLVSRTVDAAESVVISPTSITTGDSWNVIKDTVRIRGSIRTLSPAVRQYVEEHFRKLTRHLAEGYGAQVDIEYRRCCPVTVNDPAQTAMALKVAESVVGRDYLISAIEPVMGSEDFGFMLAHRPGCYVFLGASDPFDGDLNGCSPKRKSTDISGLEHLRVANACMVHEPTYDFNDKIIPVGASYFVRLVEYALTKNSCL